MARTMRRKKLRRAAMIAGAAPQPQPGNGRRRANHVGIAHARSNPPPRARRPDVRYPIIPSLQRWLKLHGSGTDGEIARTASAKRLGTSLQYLIQLGLGFRRASMPLAIKIERASHGMVPVEDLIPDADWSYLRTRKPTAGTSSSTSPSPTAEAGPPRRRRPGRPRTRERRRNSRNGIERNAAL